MRRRLFSDVSVIKILLSFYKAKNKKVFLNTIAINIKPKLMDLIRIEMRTKHYSKKNEEAHLGWIKRFIFFNDKKHPNEMCAEEIKAFINFLSVEKYVSALTQNQALQAVLFLYKNILRKNIDWINGIKSPLDNILF
jgi:hypothetical protein